MPSIALALCLLASAPSQSCDGQLRPIVSSADPAPGIPGAPDARFDSFQSVTIGSSGHVLFNARLESQFPNGALLGGSLWRWFEGTLEVAAIRNLAAPGTGGGVFLEIFERFSGIDPEGRVTFMASLFLDANTTPPVTPQNRIGIWQGAPGGLELMIREGDPAPELPGVVIDELVYAGAQRPLDGRAFTFRASFIHDANTNADNDTALYVFDPDAETIRLVAREGDAAPGVPGGIFDDFVSVNTPVGLIRSHNGSGDVAFRIGLRQGVGGVTILDDECLWAYVDGQLNFVARQSAPAPFTGGKFSSFGLDPVAMNASGSLVFRAALSDNALEPLSQLWRYEQGQLNPVTVPGTIITRGAEFPEASRFIASHAPDGAILFATSPGSGRIDHWLVADDTLRNILQTGEPTPTDPFKTFAQGDTLTLIERGDIFVSSQLDGPGCFPFGCGSLWSLDPEDKYTPVPIAQTGDTLDFSTECDGSDPQTVGLFTGPSRRNIGSEGALAFATPFGSGSALLYRGAQRADSLCEADFNNDFAVDLGDLGAFGIAFGSSAGDPNYNPAADFNGDGDIDLGDFGFFATQFGRDASDCTP